MYRNGSIYQRVLYVLALILVGPVCLMVTLSAEAGKLRRFERDVAKPKPRQTQPAPATAVVPMVVVPCNTLAYWRCDYGWWDDIRRRDDRHHHRDALPQDVAPPVELVRDPGDYLLPEFRFDLNYHYVDRNISAFDVRADMGYRAANLGLRYTQFNDPSAAERLHLVYGQAFYRVVLDAHAQWDIGAGLVNIRGQDNTTGVNVTTVVTLAAWEYAAAQFQPTWSIVHGNVMQDYDIKFAYTLSVVSMHAGYRWLLGDMEALTGPYLGMALRW